MVVKTIELWSWWWLKFNCGGSGVNKIMEKEEEKRIKVWRKRRRRRKGSKILELEEAR